MRRADLAVCCWTGIACLFLSGCHIAPQDHAPPSPLVTGCQETQVEATATAVHSSSPANATGGFRAVTFEDSLLQEEGQGSELRAALPTPIDVTGDAAPDALTLADVIAIALRANPDLYSASEQISIAEATLGRARAEFYPTLGISQEYGVTNNPVRAFMFDLNQSQLDPNVDFNSPGTRDDFHTGLMLQQNIYAGDRRRHEMHAAAARRSGAVYSLAALQNSLVFQAAEAYYRLLQADVLLDVREEAVQQVEQHLKIVDSRYRNETAVKSDVLSVEVRLAEVREALISARNARELAWAVLENVTGSPIARRSLPKDVAPAPWGGDVDQLEAAITEAQSLRPEVTAMACNRQAANEAVLMAEAGKRPRADAVASYDLYTSEFTRGNDSYFVGLVLQLNLFDGGRTRLDVETAMARLRELRAREQRLLLDIELDVRQSHLRLVDARQRLEVTTQAIEQASESLREIEVRYRGQAATITELIDSQVALSNARVRRANAEAEVEIARASLQRAVGRLADSLVQ